MSQMTESTADHTPENGPLVTSWHCRECGHCHTPDGCIGDPTPSDLWAGVSPSDCDCMEWRHEPGCFDASRPAIAECLPGCGYVIPPASTP